MKHLIVNDLHGRQEWMDQLLDWPADLESVILSGDLIDMHDESESEAEKVRRVYSFCEAMEEKQQRLVFTSGNHDLDDLILEQHPGPPLSDTEWMRFPARQQMHFVSGYQTITVTDDLLITSLRWIPWADEDFDIEPNEELFVRSSSLAKEKGIKWAVVYHEPPAHGSMIRALVESHAPDYYICGHDHFGPLKDKTPLRQVHQTVLINCGQDLSRSCPVSGILDPSQDCLLWQCGEPISFKHLST